jgi:thermitase
MEKKISIIIGLVISLFVSNLFASGLPTDKSSYIFEAQNNLITIKATNTSFKKILSDLESKVGIKTEFLGNIPDQKISLNIESHPAGSINLLLKKMSLRNYSIVYDTQLKSKVIYLLAEGFDIATVIKSKPVMLQVDFAQNAASVNRVKGSSIASETSGKNEVPVRYVADEVLIKFHLGVTDNEIEEILRKHNLIKITANSSLEKIGYIKAKIPDGRNVKTVIKEVQQEYKVKVPEPNYMACILTAEDPLYKDQWYIPETKFDLAWDKLTSNTKIKVAVIDSGTDKTHPDLQGKILPGYDFVNSDEDPADDNGHGTFISGIIAANSSDIGIKGLYDLAQIVPVKVIDQNGIGTYEDTAAGIVYAADQGARVINLSIGGYGFSFLLQDAVDYALEKGCIIVAAGGNDGIEQPMYPAAYPDVIGVSAIAQSGQIWASSNSGNHIDVSAPGVNMISLGLNQNYIMATGTSASAAIVSAQAAMLANERADLSSSFIERLIMQTSIDSGVEGWDSIYGGGVIDAENSLMQEVKPFYDVAVSKIGIDSSRVDEDGKLYVTVLLKNQGTLNPKEFDFNVSINGKEYSEKIISLKDKKLITIEYLLGEQTENVKIEAQVRLLSDVNQGNNAKSRFYIVQYDGQKKIWIMYHQNAHTFIAGEAFAEWPGELNHEIYDYIGPPEDFEYQQEYAIIEGAYNEDSNSKNPFGQYSPYLRHFWDRGNNDNATPLEGGYLGADTAVNRAYKYWTGGYRWSSTGDHNKGPYDEEWGDGDGVEGEGVIQLYLKGDQESKNRAFRYLGHIVHLLTDMALPAHVLNDPHGGVIAGGSDHYEDWISEKNSQDIPHYRRFGDVAGNVSVDSSGEKFPSVSSLRDLFQQLAEIGDDFESDGKDGSDGWDDDNKDEHYAGHKAVWGEVSEAECEIHQETLQPAAIRYVAALYKLFWDETRSHLSDGNVSPDSGDTGDTFYFSVNYLDRPGRAPSSAKVYIDGSSNDMIKISGLSVDGTYRYQTSSLSTGDHNYYFQFINTDGETVRLPESGTFSGPTIGSESPPPDPDPDQNNTYDTAFNLGQVVGEYFSNDLSIDPSRDVDYYKFSIVSTGTINDSVLIQLPIGAGKGTSDLDLAIGKLDKNGNLSPAKSTWYQSASLTDTRNEKISLEGWEPGEYYVIVFGASGYTLGEDNPDFIGTEQSNYLLLIDGPLPKVAKPSISPNGGTFNNSTQVTLSCSTTGATIRYTTDGTTPTASSTLYTNNPFTVSSSSTVKACGFKTNYTASDEAPASFTLKVATPSISPNGGTFFGLTSVTLSCSTTGATIRYTTDGTTPTTSSTLYTGSFPLSSSSTVKARGFKSDYTESDVAPASFTITAPELSVTPDSRTVDGNGGATTFAADNIGAGVMSWTATVTSGEDWLFITPVSSGTNGGTITAAFSANTSGSSRTGTIRVTAIGANSSPKEVTVIQPRECDLSDVKTMLQILSGQTPEHDQLPCYDVNGDDKTGMEEVLLILKHKNVQIGALSDYTITKLDFDHHTRWGFSSLSINDLGHIAGTCEKSDGRMHAFLYKDSMMNDLGAFAGDDSWAFGINNSGQIVGYSNISDSMVIDGNYIGPISHPFLYEDDLMKDLGTLGGDDGYAFGINNLGEVFGNFRTSAGDQHAFIYRAGEMEDIGFVDSGDAGKIVGYFEKADGRYCAFSYENEVMTELNVPNDYSSFAFGINDSGQIVGGIQTSNATAYAFIYENGISTNIDTLGSSLSVAIAINDFGQIVGYFKTSEGDQHAFLYKDGVMIDLNSLIPSNSGWELTYAVNINKMGQIVGYGLVDGERHAFLLNPVIRIP